MAEAGFDFDFWASGFRQAQMPLPVPY